ncbi:MAG: hypothetical protein R3C02_11560 [Planctomycetaceae bacterium]
MRQASQPIGCLRAEKLLLPHHFEIRMITMRYRSTHWLMMTLGVFLLPTIASAQNSNDPEGVVRLGGVRQTSCEADGYDVSGCDTGSCDNYGCDSDGCDNYWMYSDGVGSRRDQRQDRRLIRRAKVQDWLSGGAYSGSGAGCRYGACGNGGCGYGACGHGGCGYGAGCGRHMKCGVCGSGCCTNPCHAKLMHTLHWLSPYHAGCTYSPDHGWAPPGHFPCQRTAATYRNWFPNSWTGQPSNVDPNFRYPMVYQPTDTTQLGYYYQRVPQWQPRAGMIPPTPNPDEFHTPDYGTHYNGVVDVGPGCQPQGEIYGNVSYDSGYTYESGEYAEGTMVDGPTPIESESMPVIQPAPTHQPNSAQPSHSAPPAPSNAAPPGPAAPPAPAPAPVPSAGEPERSAGAPTLYPVPTF